MIVPGSTAIMLREANPARRADELLYESDSSRVFRRFRGGGSVVYKQPLGQGAVRRLRHETAMLERLSAVPGVVKLSSPAPAAGTIADFLVLEDTGGVPLSLVLREERLAIGPLLDLALQLTQTIAAMHRLGIVHRDINPSNIVLAGSQRTPVLIDFDIASTFAEERPAFAPQAEIAGTLAYIAPEQTGRTGRVMDQRADLYSLGATLYELATGRTPFECEDSFALIRAVLGQVPTSPATRDPALPQALSDIIMRLLQKEPDRRYQSAEGLTSDLSSLVDRRAHGISGVFPLGEHDFPQRLLPPSRLVGREPELVAVQNAFEDAVAGRRNGLLVAGGPGVGKTALINELRAIVTAKGGWFVKGKFDQYSPNFKWGAALQAFQSLLRLLLAEPEAELVPLRARLLAALGPNAALAAAMLPEMALLLEIVPARAPSDPRSAQDQLTQIGLDLLTCVASPARPLVFVLDDLQWASAAVLSFVDAALSQPRSPGLLFVGAYRSTEVDAAHPLAALLARWKRSRSAPQEVFLSDLRVGDLGDLLQGMLRLRPSQAGKLAEAVGARTHGNPYDTVELVNALRRDGALTPGADGWTWDEATIRQFVGHGDVTDLLSVRIDALPADSRALLEVMAALGGDVELPLLQAAAGFSALALDEWLTPALEDGLLVLEHGTAGAIRFRHDRVQQAAYGRLEPAARLRLHLALAHRLAALTEYQVIAAEQYLPVAKTVREPGERVRMVSLFRNAAARASTTANYGAAERFLATARASLGTATAPNDPLVAAVENELHAALYALGRFEQGDIIYRTIERRDGSALQLVDAACVQINSLTNRNRPGDAVTLAIDLLRRIGVDVPEPGKLAAAIGGRLDAVARWCDDAAARKADFERPEATDPQVRGAAKIISRSITAAMLTNKPILAWLVLQSLRLWTEHGPLAALIGPISLAGHVTITLGGNYRLAYRAARHIITLSEARGYEPETSLARFYFTFGVEFWFESFEETVRQARLAREGLQRGGDLQNACYTYYVSVPLLLQCSATLEGHSLEVEAGMAFSVRTRNEQTRQSLLAYRQLAKALRGETNSPGSFADASFDEAAHLAALGPNEGAVVHFHVTRALAGLLFGQTPELVRHAKAAILAAALPHDFSTVLAHILMALAIARSLRMTPADERPALLEKLARSLDRVQRRSADAPGNFLHAVRLIEAERAWALESFGAASAAFEAALKEAQSLKNPMFRALVFERAGLCYIEHGLERYGRLLLRDARQSYEVWGATGKARQLERDHAFLLDAAATMQQRSTVTGTLSSDAIDMVGILRASQALSSQTSLELLKALVVELLGALTGATAVLLFVRSESGEWLFSPADDGGAPPISEKAAGARGLVPLTAFRYVERTQEPLLLADAMRDDRFSRDPYFAGCEQCSMLGVPILSQGEPRAVLLLENRLTRGAFSAARLDAVMLIAGQFAVSLDNAVLYASLERKVAERTEALAAANEQLALLSRTDALTGLVNRRGFDEKMEAEWLRARRTGASIGLAMIDIDEFKKYNDQHGHPAGDECLRRVAQTLQDGLRPGSDVVARYGGEEFILLLPDTNLSGTKSTAERARRAVGALREHSATGVHGIVTISIGIVAFVPSESTGAAQFIKAADVALYEAKRNGRNRVERAASTSGA